MAEDAHVMSKIVILVNSLFMIIFVGNFSTPDTLNQLLIIPSLNFILLFCKVVLQIELLEVQSEVIQFALLLLHVWRLFTDTKLRIGYLILMPIIHYAISTYSLSILWAIYIFLWCHFFVLSKEQDEKCVVPLLTFFFILSSPTERIYVTGVYTVQLHELVKSTMHFMNQNFQKELKNNSGIIQEFSEILKFAVLVTISQALWGFVYFQGVFSVMHVRIEAGLFAAEDMIDSPISTAIFLMLHKFQYVVLAVPYLLWLCDGSHMKIHTILHYLLLGAFTNCASFFFKYGFRGAETVLLFDGVLSLVVFSLAGLHYWNTFANCLNSGNSNSKAFELPRIILRDKE